MTAVRVTLRAPRSDSFRWLSMGSISVTIHAAVFVAAFLIPRLLPASAAFPAVYTVDLVSLPAGAPGPPSEGPKAPAPAAAPAPSPPEPAVKIPEKPSKPPRAKPVKKPEPPRSKVEKPQPKPKPAERAPLVPTTAPESGGSGASDASHGGAGAPGGKPGFQGGAGGAGGSGFLDDATFEYAWYLERLTSILGSNWGQFQRPDLRETLRAVVHFTIHRDGTLTNIVLEQSSGDSALDRSALRAVQNSNPLPPLPYQYGKDSLGVHFFFDVQPE